jgi:FkbM family methyltransferase
MNIIRKLIKQLYWNINFQYNFKLNGSNMRGLKIYQAKTSNIDEVWMGQILKILLSVNDFAFMDVGVNIGQTLCQVKSIDNKRIYYGFEPNPACNMFVEELIRINKFSNVKIFPVGIYTDDSILELDLYYDDLTNSGGSLIKDYWEFSNIKPHRTIIVPLMKYNTIAKSTQFEKLGVVKIDVEGAELEVLEALYDKINTDRSTILIEVLSAYTIENKLRIDRQQAVLNIIKRLNYRILRIIETKKEGIKYLQEIYEFDPYFDRNQANYLLIPKEDESLFKLLKAKYEIK